MSHGTDSEHNSDADVIVRIITNSLVKFSIRFIDICTDGRGSHATL